MSIQTKNFKIVFTYNVHLKLIGHIISENTFMMCPIFYSRFY